MTRSHHRRAFVLLLVAVAFVASASHAAEPLRLRLNEGDRYLYEHTLETTTDVAVPFPQTTTQTMRYTLDQRVQEVDPETGNATIEVRFLRVFVESDLGEMGGFKVDTDEDSEQSDTYRQLIDRPFTMRITPRGKLLEVKGLTAIVRSMLAAGGLNAFSLEQVEGIVGDESMTGMYQALQPIYPEDGAREWETESSISLPMMGSAAVHVLWTLGAPREVGGVATIPMSSIGEIATASEPTKIPLEFGEMELRLKKMTSRGVIDISAEDGWPVKGEITSNGTMSMELKIPGIAIPTSANMTVTSVSVVERLELPSDE
jgi:hypothetical protein